MTDLNGGLLANAMKKRISVAQMIEKYLVSLYLKTEGISENYSDIEPPFLPKRRLKVGTFKVESTGFRLGERFVKIIFDNALQRKVDEIYVTLFTDRGELVALEELLYRWGFVFYGIKRNGEKDEKGFGETFTYNACRCNTKAKLSELLIFLQQVHSANYAPISYDASPRFTAKQRESNRLPRTRATPICTSKSVYFMGIH